MLKLKDFPQGECFTSGRMNSWASLTYFDRTRSLADMLEEFRIQKYASKMLLKASTIKIRFKIIRSSDSESLVRPCYSRSYGTTFSLQLSKRLSAYSSRSTKASSKSLKRPHADTRSNTTDDSRLKTPRTITSAIANNTWNILPAPTILKSTFKAPISAQASVHPRWSRDPPMAMYTFTHLIAAISPCGEVTLERSSEDEKIEIAVDWLLGEEAFLSNQPYHATGFIGCGTTKRAIYVCISSTKLSGLD